MNLNNKLFQEINTHLLEDKQPSLYLNEISKLKKYTLNEDLKLLFKLKEIGQSKQHHPEGSVWNHTMLVVDQAVKVKSNSQDQQIFMWGALLHDLGKIKATKIRKGRITAYEHDREGEHMGKEFLNKLIEDKEFIEKVCLLIKWHMQPLYVIKDLPFAKIKQMNEEVSISEIGLFTLCDRLGRGDLSTGNINIVKNDVIIFLNKCSRQIDENNKGRKIESSIETIKSINIV